MKSLKDIPSIRQVRLDHMLEITPQPDNTCPLIDPLIYIGRRRSPIYDLELDYEPSDLLLDESNLAERMETLELWASEVLDVYALIDKSSIDEEDFIDIDDYRKNVETKIANNRMHEVSSMVELINNIIYEWKDLHLDYLSIDRDLNRAEQEVYKLESNFDLNDEDDGYIEALEGIEHAKEEVEAVKEKMEDLKEEFNNDITRQFEKAIAKFTDLMEDVRANNDSLRQETKQLRDMVIQYVNHDYNVVQPMDYLKQLEKGKPDEISLGLVDTDYYLHSFSNLTDYLKRNGVLSDIQIVLLRKTQNLTDLLDGLKEMGYKKVMYYDDAKISMKYPEIYKEVNFKDELIKDNKNKPSI